MKELITAALQWFIYGGLAVFYTLFIAWVFYALGRNQGDRAATLRAIAAKEAEAPETLREKRLRGAE